jgi:orotidine-5'-phosphate decarboxylase
VGKLQAKDRIIIPLDMSADQASQVISQLAGKVGYFKIGLELLMATGPDHFVRLAHEAGAKVFLDGKFSDIPNTVASATSVIASMGVEMIDVHANCGRAALMAAVKAKGNTKILAVTVLTSLENTDTQELYGKPVTEVVKAFALMAVECGVDGIVCSAQEVRMIRGDPALSRLLIVTPGIRPEWADSGDQKRAVTPREAIVAGADLLVIGRPITSPPAKVGSALEAVKLIVEEIEAGLKERGEV